MKGVERQLGRGGVRAGMTLVELLIALALMVAVAGLALPNMLSILARSTTEEGRRQALAALASARAEAIGAGEPVRVMAEPGASGGGWRLRAMAVEREDEVGAARGSSWLDDAERWRPETVAALPSGWIVLAPEAGAQSGPMGGPVAPRPESAGRGGGAPVAERPGHPGGRPLDHPEAVEPVELVTFLPDGGAIAPPSRARFGAGSQQFALKVDRWSGRATLTIDRGGMDTGEAEAGETDEAMPGGGGFGDGEFGDGEFGEDPQW